MLIEEIFNRSIFLKAQVLWTASRYKKIIQKLKKKIFMLFYQLSQNFIWKNFFLLTYHTSLQYYDEFIYLIFRDL